MSVPPVDNPYARRFQAALDLHDAGVDLMRQNLRRRHPDASPEQIASMLGEWLRDRPPDGEGRVVPWPREPG